MISERNNGSGPIQQSGWLLQRWVVQSVNLSYTNPAGFELSSAAETTIYESYIEMIILMIIVSLSIYNL